MAEHISCTETAKLMRTSLKESFPGQKFSVQSKIYAGGSSISVLWHDGPNDAQVSYVTDRFEGAYFCGMSDYKGTNKHMLDGRQVTFGANFIFTNRIFSNGTIQKGINACFIKNSENWKEEGVSQPPVDDYNNGLLYAVTDPKRHCVGGQSLQHDITEQIWRRSYCATHASLTLDRIHFLGDDGYGENSVGKVHLAVVK